MSNKIIFSDNLHFHDRNFKSLMDLIGGDEFQCHYNTDFRDWMSLYGDYSTKFSSLKSIYSLISSKPANELYKYNIHGINAYEVAKAELLSYLLPKKFLYKEKLSKDEILTFNYLFENFHLELCLNIAAAHHWIEHWYKIIVEPKTKYSHAFVFSGSNIYAKALIKTCEFTQTRVIVAESSLTGNDYYLEEKLCHLANNSDIKNKAVRKFYLSQLGDEYYKDRNKAINKLILSKNKNVVQPSRSGKRVFNNGKRNVIIVGQVLNDYSIIESHLPYHSSIEIYKDVISDILNNTDFNLIFKAHPWEEKKTNCESSITYSEICDYLSLSFSDDVLDRVVVTKDYNLIELFEQSEHVIVINSQAGIEAAYSGIKPIVLGDAFYGDFGFTYDLSDLKVSKILNEAPGALSLYEYEQFELFLTIYLEYHLISIHNSGVKKIRDRFFSSNNFVPIVSPRNEEVKNIEVKKDEPLVNKNDPSYPIQIKNAIFYLFNDVDKFKRKVRRKFEKTS
ncbi:capsular polysaccharide export protein, LipB/KpsS family [Vibrio cholerae]|uniref:capsular polysaccharide export protein, LipB/KpsS family n=1 Tax=Vibrio cholerae TaxID=666 RepID=UPI00226E92B7|nr:capsule biosynthesis protein [Vibrio cholerae]MCX9439169.1 capsule biosynthesis protein [Vibrio cholerae]